MSRIVISIALIVGLGVLGSCKKDDGNKNTPMQLSDPVVSPSSVTEGDDYTVTFQATEGATGPVEAEYTLQRPEQPDSAVSRELEVTSGGFSDSFEVNSAVAGDHLLAYKFTDADAETVEDTKVISVSEQPNASAQFSDSVSTELHTRTELVFSFTVTDADGNARIAFIEASNAETDSTVITPQETEITQRFTRTYKYGQQVQWTIRQTDGKGEVSTETFTYEIVVPGDSPASFTMDVPGGRVGEELSFSFSVNDPDGIQEARLAEVLPGAPDTSFTELDINGTEASTEVSHTFATTGTYWSRVVVIDTYDNKRAKQQRSAILAELVERQTTLNFNHPSVSVVVYIEEQQVAIGGADQNGQFTFSHVLPKDSLVTYSVLADQAGLLETSYEVKSTGDQTLELAIQPVPITAPESLPGQYPRTSDIIDLSKYVTADDPEQGPLTVAFDLEYDGTAFTTSQAGNEITFTTSEASDPAGVTETFTLHASHDYLDTTFTITKEIFDRRDIEFLVASFSVVERDSLVIDLTEVLSSEAEITAASITNASSGLEVSNEGFIYSLTPTENISADKTYTFDIEVENRDGKAESQQASLVSEALPEFSATVVDHVKEQPVGKAYVVTEGANKNAMDSLVVNGGVFTGIEMPAEAEGFRFGELRNERPYALEHRIFPQENESYIVPVGNRDKYDKFKNLIGTFTEDEMMRRWADGELICGNAGLEGINSSGDFYRLTDELCGWAQENGSLPAKIVIGKFVKTDFYNFSADEWQTRTDSMSVLTLDVTVDNFENEYSVSLPGLPEPTVVDTLHYDFRNQEENALYIVPRSRLNDSRGTVDFYGTKGDDTGTIKHVLITLRSNSGMDSNYEGQQGTLDQEAGAALYEQGRAQARNLGNYESIVKEGHPVSGREIFPLNLWMGWMNTSNLYKNAPNQNTFTNASSIPKVWNPDYESLTTACDLLFEKDCSDEGY